jgi:hypothetical protein
VRMVVSLTSKPSHFTTWAFAKIDKLTFKVIHVTFAV